MEHTEKSMFNIIKKQNGETFAQAVRKAGVLAFPDIDKIVRHAGRNPLPLMDYLISLKDIKIEETQIVQNPFELLKQAGYDAYYADTLEKQNAISPYYAKGEELCTFNSNNTDRHEKYHIINAVKHNVNKIKRSENPEREDEYGTSVLSIQILKTGGDISIKNRYNHKVSDPDNTLNSNPDNIIQGLSASLKKYFDVDFSSQPESIPDGYRLFNGKIYKHKFEINNTYFGEDFYATDGVVSELDKNSEIMMDYFVLDLKNKTIKNPSNIEDGFNAALGQEIEGKKLQIRINEAGHKCLLANDIQLLELEKDQIISVHLPTVTEIGDDFLYHNKGATHFSAPLAQKFGDNFLYSNDTLTFFEAPNAQIFGDNVLINNKNLTHFSAPMAQTFGDAFLFYNEMLIYFNAPMAQTFGDDFLCFNKCLTHFDAPMAQTFGDDFLFYNEMLIYFNAPMAQTFGTDFLFGNKTLAHFNATVPEEQKKNCFRHHPDREALFSTSSLRQTLQEKAQLDKGAKSNAQGRPLSPHER